MKSTRLIPAIIEPLEARIAPAVHTWTGGGTNNLWSNALNWTGGSPATDASGNIDLVFPTNAAQLVVQNDIASLVVDSITFSASGGTSANGYTINGNTFTINTGAAGENPLGIDVVTGVADAANGITQTFNTAITLVTNDATFRTAQNGSRLTFHGDIALGGRTLTLDIAGSNNANTQGFVIDGIISNGSVVKNSGGTLELSGANSYANFTANNGVVLATSDLAFGANAGTVTINDPAHVELRNGVTVVKTTLNLNSNQLGGGLGADGNTTNTFRGSVVLMAGAGGVALGAGVGAANANTRLIIDGVISGATSTLSLNGAGVIEFTQNNTYTGLTNHNGNNGSGSLQIDSPGGLGAGGAGNETQLNRNGAGPTGTALWLNFDGTLADAGAVGERIFMAGSGVSGLGAVRVIGDHDAVISGNVTFIAGAPHAIGADTGSLTITSVIDSQAANRPLRKVGGGTLVLGGTAQSTYVSGTFVDGGVLSIANTSGSPLGSVLGGVVTVGNTGTLRVEAGSSVPNVIQLNAGGALAVIGGVSGAVQLNAGGTLMGTGSVTGAVTSTGGIVSPGTSAAGLLTVRSLTLDAASKFVVEIAGPAAGVTFDQLITNTAIPTLGGTLQVTTSFDPADQDKFIILSNTTASQITTTFTNLPQGGVVGDGTRFFQIDYSGGDGNDVELTRLVRVATLSADKHSATFTDPDGDLVTVKSKVVEFDGSEFTLVPAGFGQARETLGRLQLGAAFAGQTITITAKGGNGFANIGYLDATGVDLGALSIPGDLGRIDAGAVKSLTVQSLGALGLASQGGVGNLTSHFTGKLGKLTVKSSIHGAAILGSTSIGAVKVLGSFLGGQLTSGADLGAIDIRGDIAGTAAAPVVISAFGKTVAPTKGTDLAIKSLKVGGGVEFLRVLAGYDIALAAQNADAAIGAITVGADWRASSVLAGVTAGVDGRDGTADDAKIAGTRDTATIFSQIASLTIKGQAFGTASSSTDTFGVVAEQITKAKVGGVSLKFDKGERDAADAFALAATGPGATGLGSDFFLREIVV